ncbi:hypothetical protein ACHAPU_002414 [Fusarium lateritium]
MEQEAENTHVTIGVITDGRNEALTVRLHDLKSTLPNVYHQDEASWAKHGMRVFRHRHHGSQGFDNGAKLLSHTDNMARALRDELELRRTPICIEANILYGTINPTLVNMDVNQVGPISVMIEQDTPSSCVRTDFSQATAENSLRAYFGDRAFDCMAEANGEWEILEVSHPLTSAMQSYPFIVGDPAARSDGKYKKWMVLGGQQPFELLVRRIASSSEENDAVVPLVSTNVTGNLQAQPEDRMTIKFVAWKPRT